MNSCNDKPKTLYYYCSTMDFIDFVSNKRLVFKDLFKSDKHSDCYTFVDALISQIPTRSNLLEQLQSHLLKQPFQAIKIVCVPLVYALRLTSNYNKRNDYERNSAEMCIGLNIDYFFDFMCDDLFVIKKVEYDKSNIENESAEIIKKVLFDSQNDNKDVQKRLKKIYDCVSSDFLFNAFSYKDESFSNENEYSIMLNLFIKELFLEVSSSLKKDASIQKTFEYSPNNVSLSRAEYTVLNNKLISYRCLNNIDISSIVKSVNINPKCEIETYDIKMVFELNNLEFDGKVVKENF